MTALPHHCGRCPARWAAATVCHCTACHLTFSGEKGFVFHQVKQGGVCLTTGQLLRKGYLEVRPGILGRPTPAGAYVAGVSR